MQQNEQNIDWAMEQLQAFADRRGFPGTEHPIAFEAQAKAFLRIVHNKPVHDIIGKPHSIIGDPNDVEWLIGEALDKYDHYPQPIELRRIYQEFLPPADGKTIIEGVW